MVGVTLDVDSLCQIPCTVEAASSRRTDPLKNSATSFCFCVFGEALFNKRGRGFQGEEKNLVDVEREGDQTISAPKYNRWP